ncbi:hypothetical protein CA983_36130 [Streptomyces swartbergensis]|uniref:Uncharacterized protein n=1 Tax=Streptomyces swartbergensis TaxID=487165 RepID=A0A243RFV7_9ACTN|nr:hypothetical protein CA983_36130 [Streptomyces swartbergensis]
MRTCTVSHVGRRAAGHSTAVSPTISTTMVGHTGKPTISVDLMSKAVAMIRAPATTPRAETVLMDIAVGPAPRRRDRPNG